MKIIATVSIIMAIIFAVIGYLTYTDIILSVLMYTLAIILCWISIETVIILYRKHEDNN